MVYEMNDLKGILFLVLLKTIAITSTNIDCSGNAFHCVNSTHFMICVDLGGGVPITIDDVIIPCPPATVCDQSNRFECEYPKSTTTPYPFGVIGVTKPEIAEIGRDGLRTGYVTELPGISHPVSSSTVTEEVTTLSNVEILEIVTETDTIVESSTEITGINHSNASNNINNISEIAANVKIKTSTHESMSSPNDTLFHEESVIETVLDKPERNNIVKEILNGNITINEVNNNTKNIYETISNKINLGSNYNATFANESKLNNKNVPATVNNLQQGAHGIQNNIAKQALSTILSEGLFIMNSDSKRNAKNFNKSDVFTIATTIISSETTSATTEIEHRGVTEKNIVYKNSTEIVLANDSTTSQSTENTFTENGILIDQVNTLSTEATHIKYITSNKNQTSGSGNQTDRNLNRKIYQDQSTANFSETQSTSNNGPSLTTTMIPHEITTSEFIIEYHNVNVPIISKKNITETLIANEYTTTEATIIEDTSQISTQTPEAIYIQELVNQSSSIKVTEIYENAKDVTTTDQVPSERTGRSTTNSSNDETLSSTTPSTTVRLETNTASVPHRNNVEMIKTGISFSDILSSTNQMNTQPTDNLHVDNPLKEINQNIEENNITAGITYDAIIKINETSTGPLQTTTNIPLGSSDIQTVSSYDEHLTTTETTETINAFVTDNQIRLADELITTMTPYNKINLFTEQVNTVPTDASYIQDVYVDKNPIDDLINASIQNNKQNEVYQNVKDKLINTNKTIDITIDPGLSTTSTEKSVELIVNNMEQLNYEPSFISTASTSPSIETTSVQLTTEYHGPIVTNTNGRNEIQTTTEAYVTEYILFADHADELSTEPTNIQDVPIKNPIIEINKSKLNEFNQDKKINITLQFINDPLINKTSTIDTRQDTPFPDLTKELLISSVTHTNIGPTINISSTPLEKPLTSPIIDYSELKIKDKVLVTSSKENITDNRLLTDETNISSMEETYYNRLKNQIIPVNQTNLNNLQKTTGTSALITESLVNKTGTTEPLIPTTFPEYYNSSYNIQKNITDRDQIVKISSIPVKPIVLQVNCSERTSARNKLDQNVTESNSTLWKVNESTDNETNTTVMSIISTNKLFQPNVNNTEIFIDNNQQLSTINNTNIPPTSSTHTTVLNTEYNVMLPQEIITTTETIFAESTTVIDKVYIESQVDIYPDIINKTSIAEPADLQQFQKLQHKFINNTNIDVATGIKNDTSLIEGIPLTTMQSIYNDLTDHGSSSTQLDDNMELQTEKSIAVISFTTQHTLQSDDISVLSDNEKGSKFMTPSPILSITHNNRSNETTSKLNTDSNLELVHNNTPTLPSDVIEILNTSTSAQFDTTTNRLTIDHLEEIVTTAKVNKLNLQTANIIELTTPMIQTANPFEKIMLENIRQHTLVSTIPYSSTIINPSTESNINNTAAKNDFVINTINATLDKDNSRINIEGNEVTTETIVGNSSEIITTTENIGDSQMDLSTVDIVTELPIVGKYTIVHPVNESSPVSVGMHHTVHNDTLNFETLTETAVLFLNDTFISTAGRNKQFLQIRPVLRDSRHNNTIVKNNTSNNGIQNLTNIVLVNEVPNNSILNRINSSWDSVTINISNHNITENGFIRADNKLPVNELPISKPESSTQRLEGGTQNNVIYSQSPPTSQTQQILPLPALDVKFKESNQIINRSSSNSLLNTSIDALASGTSEPIEYSKTTESLYTGENMLINTPHSTKYFDGGLQIPNLNFVLTENINNSSYSIINVIVKVNSSERLHNQGDLKVQVRTVNNQNASEIQNNKQLNNTINTVKQQVNLTTNITDNRNINNKNIVNNFQFSCLNRSRGKYADNNDCRKFYICIGRPEPLAGTCPFNTVFSEINKQCTRNLSHCVRNNQFRCLLEGRFSDFFRDNVYYICIKNNVNNFVRYKLQCQNEFHLNKDTVKCEYNVEVSSSSTSSISENSQKSKDNSESKQNTEQNQEANFECNKEGKFPYPNDCRKYYVCSKNSKAEYRRKIKHCSSDEVFDSEKKKCIESESNGC